MHGPDSILIPANVILEAMTIMAFALPLDPAYVAAHQVARYIGLVLLMPAMSAYLLRSLNNG